MPAVRNAIADRRKLITAPMAATAQQSQYWAYALTVAGSSGSVEGFSRSIANARVDLNPH